MNSDVDTTRQTDGIRPRRNRLGNLGEAKAPVKRRPVHELAVFLRQGAGGRIRILMWITFSVE